MLHWGDGDKLDNAVIELHMNRAIEFQRIFAVVLSGYGNKIIMF